MPLPPRPVVLAALGLRRRLKRLADSFIPPEIAALDLITGVAPTQIAVVMVELGFADLIANGSLTASQVADMAGTDPDVTHRLLRAAAGYGLCTMNRRSGAVRLTRTGKVLRRDHPASLREWAVYMSLRSTVDAWSDLPSSVRTGDSAFQRVHGVSMWQWFNEHRDEQSLFNVLMRRLTEFNSAAIVKAYPWPSGGVVCDVAGGTGTLIATVVSTSHAGLRGVLVDGPGVIAQAEEFLDNRDLATRIDRVEGDIFETITATADVYLLKDVLHDWDDARCRKILRTVAATMPSGSRLVLVEMIQQPNAANLFAPFVDLQMLTLTDGGRQRSVDELAALLIDADLRPTGRVLQAGTHDLVEAQKP